MHSYHIGKLVKNNRNTPKKRSSNYTLLLKFIFLSIIIYIFYEGAMDLGNIVSIKELGAQGNNIVETAVLQKIFKSVKGNVLLPEGVYVHDDVIVMQDNTVLDGTGEFRDVGGVQTAIVMGNNCVVKNIKLTSTAKTRRSNMESSSILVYGKKKCLIENVTIDGSASAGIMVVNSSNVNIVGCTVRNTLADGIHITGGSNNVYVSSNTCEETGDDAYAVVSYQKDRNLCKNIRVASNYSYHSKSRGIAVVGGMNIEIINNQVLECKNAGVYIAQESAFNTYGSENISVLSNRIISANQYNPVVQYAGIHIASDNDNFPCRNITIQSNMVYKSNWKAILLDSKKKTIRVSNVDIISNDIDTNYESEAICAIYVKDIRIIYNKIRNIMKYGIFVEGNRQCGIHSIIGNYIENVNLMGDKNIDGITTFVPNSNISFNTIIDSGNRLERAIEADSSTGSVIFGNQSIDDKPTVFNTNSSLIQTRKSVEGKLAPTVGMWKIGDEVININPSEMGSSSKKYIVDKWVCIKAGIPGTWKECRTLTGG